MPPSVARTLFNSASNFNEGLAFSHERGMFTERSLLPIPLIGVHSTPVKGMMEFLGFKFIGEFFHTFNSRIIEVIRLS